MSKTPPRRVLHWVLKTTSLPQCVDFYHNVFNFTVLRHEEFEDACEAGCNGKFNGAWSKTMLGRISERNGFCLEIICNYAITRMQRGNAYVGMVVRDPTGEMKSRALEWWKKQPKQPLIINQGTGVFDPDENLIEFVTTPAGASTNDIVALMLQVTKVEESIEFYQRKFDANVMSANMVSLGTGPMLQFMQIPRDAPDQFVFHGQNQGRLAIETPDGDPDRIASRFSDGIIIFGPASLPPHNERVGVFADPDGHEFAFVEASGYAKCIDAGGQTIDWKYRDRFKTDATG